MFFHSVKLMAFIMPSYSDFIIKWIFGEFMFSSYDRVFEEQLCNPANMLRLKSDETSINKGGGGAIASCYFEVETELNPQTKQIACLSPTKGIRTITSCLHVYPPLKHGGSSCFTQVLNHTV